MTRHTSGPWKTHLCNDTSIIDGEGNDIAQVSGDYENPAVWPVMEANARLMAAAPELLEALKELADLFDDFVEGKYRPDSFTSQPARAAIARAEGRS